mmetsp:Transcript_10665/g.12855  ORF Transcript_10665/g.12855 Transcript_10665/m.12855 type:complete len:496 (+) Transcript_10665:77-1564(+)
MRAAGKNLRRSVERILFKKETTSILKIMNNTGMYMAMYVYTTVKDEEVTSEEVETGVPSPEDTEAEVNDADKRKSRIQDTLKRLPEKITRIISKETQSVRHFKKIAPWSETEITEVLDHKSWEYMMRIEIVFANSHRITLNVNQYDACRSKFTSFFPLDGRHRHYYECTQAVSDDTMNLFAVFPKVTTASWMREVPGNVCLTELSIPGTHDSCARSALVPHAKCQNLRLGDQLKSGIRFIDIRCRHFKDSFDIYHGPIYQNMSFHDVLECCLDFLETHSYECILMSVKEESSPAKNTRSFFETFIWHLNSYPTDRFYLGDKVPKLSKVRGRIVLLRRFKKETGLPCGIDLSHWTNNNETFTHTNKENVTYHIQDIFKVDWAGNKKMAEIEKHFEEAQQTSGVLCMNFLSGTNLAATPLAFAQDINLRFNLYLSGRHTGKRLGIIVMDFCDIPSSNIKLILCNNQRKGWLEAVGDSVYDTVAGIFNGGYDGREPSL